MKTHYLLKRTSHSSYQITAELNDVELDAIKKAIIELEKYEKFDLSFCICLQNSRELADLISKLQDFQSSEIGHLEQRMMKYKVSKLISNFISSYYNFLAFCESNAEGWFGSQCKIEVKQIISSFYDDNYFYKFLYKFRNYITHKGLPIHLIFLSEGKFQIILSIRLLLDEFQEWGADLKNELKNNFEENLNLIELFSNCDKAFLLIAKKLNEYFISKVSSSKLVVSSFLKEEITLASEYKIYSSLKPINLSEVGKSQDLTIYSIPLEAFRNS